jgi:ketosteroid isomerase-like protein
VLGGRVVKAKEAQMPHSNESVVRGYIAALERGDQDAARDYFTEDVVFRFPGRSQLADTYRGRDAYFGDYLTKLDDLTQGRVHVIELIDVLASDRRAAVVAEVRFEREGHEPLTVVRAVLYRLRGGRIEEFWVFDDDQYAVDAFFA